MWKTLRNYAETNNSMLGKNLNLKGESLVDVFIVRDSIEESESFNRAVSSKLIDEHYPLLTGYLESLNVAKQAHNCKTIEEIEKLRIDQVPPDLFENLVKSLNALKELKDTERMFILIKVSDVLIRGATKWVEDVLMQRAQVIAMEKKRGPKIITL